MILTIILYSNSFKKSTVVKKKIAQQNVIYNYFLFTLIISALCFACNEPPTKQANTATKAPPATKTTISPKDILGKSNSLAISYGGYREKSRDQQPTVEQLKEDMNCLLYTSPSPRD